jgi:hypothetical protein
MDNVTLRIRVTTSLYHIGTALRNFILPQLIHHLIAAEKKATRRPPYG